MTKDEALKLALDALEAVYIQGDVECVATPEGTIYLRPAIAAIKEALAVPRQEPVARVAEVHMSRYTLEWTNGPLPEGTELFSAQPPLPVQPVQEVAAFIAAEDKKVASRYGYVPKLHPSEWQDAQPEKRNFCPRCGKRTADLTTIHTCTPPQIDPNQWAFDNGLEST